MNTMYWSVVSCQLCESPILHPLSCILYPLPGLGCAPPLNGLIVDDDQLARAAAFLCRPVQAQEDLSFVQDRGRMVGELHLREAEADRVGAVGEHERAGGGAGRVRAVEVGVVAGEGDSAR